MSLYRLICGKVEYEQVIDSGPENQLRKKQESRINELESLGFRFLCCYSESFATSRLLLLLPVPFVLSLLLGGEVIRFSDGRIHTHAMLLISSDNTTYAAVFALGVMYYTGFSDSTFLVTMNHPSVTIPDSHRPPLMKRYRKGSIADAWADHQSSIRSMEVAGKHVVREVNFQSYVDMVRREADILS